MKTHYCSALTTIKCKKLTPFVKKKNKKHMNGPLLCNNSLQSPTAKYLVMNASDAAARWSSEWKMHVPNVCVASLWQNPEGHSWKRFAFACGSWINLFKIYLNTTGPSCFQTGLSALMEGLMSNHNARSEPTIVLQRWRNRDQRSLNLHFFFFF